MALPYLFTTSWERKLSGEVGQYFWYSGFFFLLPSLFPVYLFLLDWSFRKARDADMADASFPEPPRTSSCLRTQNRGSLSSGTIDHVIRAWSEGLSSQCIIQIPTDYMIEEVEIQSLLGRRRCDGQACLSLHDLPIKGPRIFLSNRFSDTSCLSLWVIILSKENGHHHSMTYSLTPVSE